ncbi:MFS transporter [Mycolicibacterium anyangense]|uniref:MFS transporter n=1 Tax=Mycolicibacterium anyangense TaxID=1431246 RepID=A0A6N4W7H6_9MYCO|nr:MFS transporter [Mycolicibacterium anyangense]BBZ75982.1 MFS transporter [Mycolicibacterium anyangense]
MSASNATTPPAGELRRSLSALDWVNFFLADVQAGLGPFLGIYLINKEGWNPASIGLVLTLGGVVGLLLNTPAGALIDRTTHKRGLLMGAAALTAVGTFVVTLAPSLAVVTAAQLMTGIAAVVLGPVIGAIALGLVGPRAFAAKTGRMQAFNHAGNVVGSTVYGLAGYLVSLRAGFWIASACGIFVVACTLAIKARLIDNDVARGLTPEPDGVDQPSGLTVLLHNRALLMLALVTMLWQLANGAMLPITGQKLAVADIHEGALFQAALIIVAQLVMIPMAIVVGRNADRWGRKPLFVLAFLVLPVRGLLFVLASGATSIIAIQTLDGVGAGLQGALFPIMVADLTRGSGRFNVALGAATTVQGIGAALSTTLAGAIVVIGGYDAAMTVLTAIAIVALVLLVFAVPETAPRAARTRRHDLDPPGDARGEPVPA